MHVFSDESKTHELLTITGRSVITTTPTFGVVDAETHEKIGVLQRRGIKSMFRDKWLLLDPTTDQPIGEITEEGAAILHRFFKFIPQTYGITLRGQRIGEVKRKFTLVALIATMDLRSDVSKSLDRRLALAAGVLLQLIEGRQD